jgi:hypothetical protein
MLLSKDLGEGLDGFISRQAAGGCLASSLMRSIRSLAFCSLSFLLRLPFCFGELSHLGHVCMT